MLAKDKNMWRKFEIGNQRNIKIGQISKQAKYQNWQNIKIDKISKLAKYQNWQYIKIGKIPKKNMS